MPAEPYPEIHAPRVSPPATGGPMVLHVRCVSGRGGGPEKTILRSPEHLERLGYRGMAAYLFDAGDAGFEGLLDWAEEEKCPLVGVPDGGALDRTLVAKFAYLCERYDVRIWHGHDYKSNWLGWLVRRRVSRPLTLVTTAHGWVHKTWKTPLYFAIDRWCLRRYEHVIAVSGDLFEACGKARVPAERLTLIHNAIESDRFGPDERTAQAKAKRTRPVIGAVGRLAHEKGFDHLIRAVCTLRNEGHDVALEIAGEGPEQAALEAQIDASGHGNSITLLGHQSDKHALYSRFDIYALSSLREGLPNVILEALAMALPVVATRCGGVEEAVTDGREALLCASGSAEELVAPLRRLLTDPELCQGLSRRGRERIERDFDFAGRMARVTAIYNHLLA
ncbi:MAG: glycosyltransferase family 4 protein [Planctomycetes bacterium]|nr:glycosyltransferase family 4 protein [Planctomycetota bacterium]